jgi:RNA polymerase sigma-54 factor
MPFELKQNLKLTQQLIMTPQLQQSIKLLQLSRLELVAAINKELEENPLLEERNYDDDADGEITPEMNDIKGELTTKEITGEGDGRDDFDWDGYLEDFGPVGGTYSHEDIEAPSLENVLTKTGTLTDHLRWQLNLSHFSEEEKRVGEQIIGNLDNNGYLVANLDEIASIENEEKDFVEGVLAKVQEFDPPGVAARDLKECLMIQVRLLDISSNLLGKIIEEHLNDLVTKNYHVIARKQKVSIEEVQAAVLLIDRLDPKPGSLYNEERPQYVIPDVFVFKVGDEYKIVLNDDGLPRLKLSSLYRKILGDKSDNSTGENNKTYIKDRMQSAIWLIKSIQQRQKTIYKVSESIVRHQKDYFDLGINYLKPMVLRDVAYDVDMHESTISRVTTNKYMHTPRGIFELKYFFNSGIHRTDGDSIASESVKEKIRKIIAEEDKKKPYKDSEIVNILKGSNISIARRTVAKYREMMGIIPSSKRKKYF